ncbi:hypothetical protein RFI_02412, partial [Reticulomyxa filosa]
STLSRGCIHAAEAGVLIVEPDSYTIPNVPPMQIAMMPQSNKSVSLDNDCIVIFCDGSKYPNPGIGGAGFVIQDPSMPNWLELEHLITGITTNRSNEIITDSIASSLSIDLLDHSGIPGNDKADLVANNARKKALQLQPDLNQQHRLAAFLNNHGLNPYFTEQWNRRWIFEGVDNPRHIRVSDCIWREEEEIVEHFLMECLRYQELRSRYQCTVPVDETIHHWGSIEDDSIAELSVIPVQNKQENTSKEEKKNIWKQKMKVRKCDISDRYLGKKERHWQVRSTHTFSMTCKLQQPNNWRISIKCNEKENEEKTKK